MDNVICRLNPKTRGPILCKVMQSSRMASMIRARIRHRWQKVTQVNWQIACESALQAHSRTDALRFWGKSFESPTGPLPVFDYRFEHTLAAVKIGRWLAQILQADAEIVECALWLHDCRKYLADHHGPDTHAEKAAQVVPEILEGTNFPKHKIAAVQAAIRSHVGLHREGADQKSLSPLENACVWDADKLSKLGVASLIHYGCISGGFGPVSTLHLLERGEHWIGVVEGIARSMNTFPAKQEAQKRVEFLKDYYRRLRQEWSDQAWSEDMQENP